MSRVFNCLNKTGEITAATITVSQMKTPRPLNLYLWQQVSTPNTSQRLGLNTFT